jgi:ribosomal RNA-processing protein 9
MPDAFFASKKRKRSTSIKKQPHKDRSSRPPKSNCVQPKSKPKKRREDEELDLDRTDQDDAAIDDLDLRADDEPESSGDEDIDETPAEKRLRLANLYLQNVTEGLGEHACVHAIPLVYVTRTAEGEFDAAEVDKELISARLRQDVLEHSGKLHLFIADTVSRIHIAIALWVSTACLV